MTRGIPRRIRRFARRHQFASAFAMVFGLLGFAALARFLLGARGSFVIEILLSGFLTAVLALATRALVRGARDPRMSRSNRWILTGCAVVPAVFAILVGLQFGQLLADTSLPFDRIDTDVIGYRSGSGGRLPSHARIETTSGSFDLPFLVPRPAGLSTGEHVLVVTHFERLVMDVLPPGG
jgi:hypothetical protein